MENCKISIKNPLKHLELFIWAGIFILLFMGGLRLGIYISLINSTVEISGMIIISTISRTVLIPFFLDRGRQILYIITSGPVILLMAMCLVTLEKLIYQYFDVKIPEEYEYTEKMVHTLLTFKWTILLGSTFFVTTVQHTMAKTKEMAQKTIQLHTEKKDMELKFLKSQINPHFLFNALNNIYSMVYTNDSKAPESILQLSSMLRYLTDDCLAEKVPVEREIQYIENFILFQKMRIGESRKIVFNKDIHKSSVMIPPMILQPLVENCFKHSRIEANKNGYIYIEMYIKENKLYFVTENSKAPKLSNIKEREGGLGISNIKQRLALSFPNQYSFSINDDELRHRVEFDLIFNI